jgi:hypothetical protein
MPSDIEQASNDTDRDQSLDTLTTAVRVGSREDGKSEPADKKIEEDRARIVCVPERSHRIDLVSHI